MFLLLLDPLQDVDQMGAILQDPVHCLRLLRKSVNQIKRKEYEIVFVDGLLTDGEKEVCSGVGGHDIIALVTDWSMVMS